MPQLFTKRGNRAFRKRTKRITREVNQFAINIVHGRNDYSPSVRQFLVVHGEKKIVRLEIRRDPIVSVIQKSLDFLSGGKVPYDKLFHLRLNFTLDNGYQGSLEKNEVIVIGKSQPSKRGGNTMQIMEQPNVSLNEWLNKTKELMGQRYFKYSGSSNNCQDYIRANLNANGINNGSYDAFVKQDTEAIFKNNPLLRKFSNTVTDIGGRADVLISGSGLQKKCRSCSRFI